MQSVLIMQCFICKVSLLCTALYAKCPYYVLLYTQTLAGPTGAPTSRAPTVLGQTWSPTGAPTTAYPTVDNCATGPCKNNGVCTVGYFQPRICCAYFLVLGCI